MKRGLVLALALALFPFLAFPGRAGGEGLPQAPARRIAAPLLPREAGDEERVAAQELEQALALGLAQEVREEQLTYRTFFPILDRLVELVDPTLEDIWKNRYPWVRSMDEPMARGMGIYLTYCAAETLGPAFTGGVDWRWGEIHKVIGEGVWREYDIDWDLISDALQPAAFGDTPEGWRHAVAYFFSFAQYSRTTGNRLFDYDPVSNSMRLRDPLTQREALLAAVRLYNVRGTPAP